MIASSPMPARGGGDGAVVADDQRGAHEQLGDVGGAAAGGGGAGGELEAGDADRRSVDDDVVRVEPTVRDARLRAAPRPAVQRSASSASVTDAGSTSTSRVPASGACRDQRHARTGGAGDDDGRHAHLGALGEEQRVRLRLDVLEAGRVQGRPAVLVREGAPELRQQLGVGLVAPEHPHRRASPSASRARHRGAGARLRRAGGARRRPSTPSSPSVAVTCAVVGRPPGEPNARCTSAAIDQPSATAGERAVGERGAEVQRRDRDQQHEELAEPPHRAREVRRRHRDDRDDDRDPHRGEVAVSSPMRVTMSRLCCRLAFSTTSAPMSRASTQVTTPADGEVAGEAPPPRHQRRDHDEADGPQRAHRVEEAEEGLELVGQAVEEGEEVALELGRVVLVPDREREDRDADDEPDPVAGAPTVRLLRGGAERVRAPRRHPREVAGVAGAGSRHTRGSIADRAGSIVDCGGQRGRTTSGSGCR